MEVNSNGEKRYVSLFMQMVSQHHDDNCYVFMAPYISDASADSIINNYYSFMDLSGNCYIPSKRIILHYQGKENIFIGKKERNNIFQSHQRLHRLFCELC